VQISIILGVAALVYSFLLTPVVRNVFLHLGLVDEPDNIRKLHTRQTPRVGGISVFLSYLLAFLTLFLVPSFRHNPLVVFPGNFWLLLAVPTVFLTGLIDDLVGLAPKSKMAGQFIAAVLAWMGGIQIHLFHGMPLDGPISLLVTVSWILVCTNAVNLIDGLDGLAAGVGLFATATMLAAALLDHNFPLVLVTVPLVGCLLGFLRYNFNPASVFLGDCGSLTIGFLLACFGALWSQKINTVLGLSAPLMAMSLPLVDTSLAIARRFLRNHPIFTGDRGHIHHRLLDRGNSPRQTAVLLYFACVIAAVLALAQQSLYRQLGVVVIVIFCLVVWAGVHYLGYMEFGFARRFFATGTLFRLIDDQIKLHVLEKSLPTARTEKEAFDQICRTCKDLGFTEVMIGQKNDEAELSRHRPGFHMSIPLGDDHVVLLGGLAGTGRPVALPQLVSLLGQGLPDGIWETEAVTEVHEIIPLLESFGSPSKISVANQ
jgi:UDP-GlcNAc:undecaprenyl-phosphate GlcNAc-1-phosphate transferase